MALRSGVDMDITYEPAYMGPLVEGCFRMRLHAQEALVDRAVRRVLELKISSSMGCSIIPYAGPEPIAAAG